MAYSKEAVWHLMSKYKLKIESDSNNINLICGICKKLMIDACKTVCECQYCYKCISEYLADGDKYCLGKKEDCKEVKLKLGEHVHKNVLLNKRIMSVKVRCPNPSCECITVLTQMEDHLRVCTKQEIKCPFVQIGCDNEGAPQDVMETHLQHETFTHSQLLIELIQNLRNEVDGLKNKFEKSQLEISSLKEELTVKNKKMNDQIYSPKREMTAPMEARQLEWEATQKKKLEKLEEELKKVRNEMELRLTAMKEETGDGKGTMKVQRRSNEMREKYGEWNEKAMNNFDYVWKIDKCMMKMGKEIFSESFHSNNYKLCLCIFIGEEDIYLSCVIMRGDNDDRVPWPMKLSVTLGILNQDTHSTHTSGTTQYATNQYKSVFDRPKADKNEFGIPVARPFIKYSSIKDDKSVVLDDSIIVSCVLGKRT